MLKITYNQLLRIVKGEEPNFTVSFDGFPDEDSAKWIRDGVENRICEFVYELDKSTYHFCYKKSPTKQLRFPEDFVGNEPIKGITFVSNEEKIPEVIPTPEQIADKELWAEYLKVEVTPMAPKKVPKDVIQKCVEFVATQKWNMITLRKVIVPICIEYKVDDKTFWRHIQKETSKYKKKHKLW